MTDQIDQVHRVLEIKLLASQHFSFPAKDINGPIRKRDVARMRQAAHYAAREYTTLSLPELGRQFNRDHTTLLNSIEVCERALTQGGVSTGERKAARSFQPELKAFISLVADQLGQINIIADYHEGVVEALKNEEAHTKTLRDELERVTRQRDEFWRRLQNSGYRDPTDPVQLENFRLKKEVKELKDEIKIARAMSMGFLNGNKNQSLPR